MTTRAENLVLGALTPERALTPADIKRRLPGRVPVATIRSLLASLHQRGLVQTGHSQAHPGVTAWVPAP